MPFDPNDLAWEAPTDSGDDRAWTLFAADLDGCFSKSVDLDDGTTKYSRIGWTAYEKHHGNDEYSADDANDIIKGWTVIAVHHHDQE